MSYRESRRRKESAEAKLKELQLQEKEGTLVEIAKVCSTVFEAARGARNKLMGIPDRVVPLLASAKNEHEAHEILAKEIRQICDELSDGLSQYA